MPVDVLSQLQELSWRDISVPSVLVNTKCSHSVVAHKRMDRDGALLENTGRDPLFVTVRIPFINTFDQGQNETWDGPLFPDVYEKFVEALKDRSPGDFQHPTYGRFRALVMDWSETLDPDFRGGPTIEVSFQETVDDTEQTGESGESSFSIAQGAAVELDGAIIEIPPEEQPNLSLDGFDSFVDFVRSVIRVGNQADLMRSQAVAKIDRMIGIVDDLQDAGEQVDAGFRDTAGRFISAMHTLKKTLASKAADKGVYIVPKPTTVVSIALRLKNTPPEILTLNPLLALKPIVPKETLVRYYQK